jgi:hypothetical protein
VLSFLEEQGEIETLALKICGNAKRVFDDGNSG